MIAHPSDSRHSRISIPYTIISSAFPLFSLATLRTLSYFFPNLSSCWLGLMSSNFKSIMEREGLRPLTKIGTDDPNAMQCNVVLFLFFYSLSVVLCFFFFFAFWIFGFVLFLWFEAEYAYKALRVWDAKDQIGMMRRLG